MLLRQLRLQNIRSYIDETIYFPEGSTLLSGDIGSGKSTVLLSIEFALFGSSRPDLPAESLLRKGEVKGAVELTFELEGQEITIQRNLKKEKDSIKQLSGHMIINSIKKELMPVELKSEMLTLLGYPEDTLSKNKNYIFRYTVYTPQEEMKFILQEDPEARLDVLRKVFNTDRYKIIRENLQLYLKKIRADITVFKAKTESLQEYQQQSLQWQDELNKHSELLKIALVEMEIIKGHNSDNKKKYEALEAQHKEFLSLQNQLKTILILIDDRQKRIGEITRKQSWLQEEIKNLSLPEFDRSQTVKEAAEIEERKNQHITKKIMLEARIKHFQEQALQLQKEAAELSLELDSIEEKKKTQQELSLKITKKKESLDKKTEIDELLDMTSALIVKNKTLLAQSKDLQINVLGLENCPTCLQYVSEEHKHHIIGQEQVKVNKAQHMLDELEQKKKEISVQKEQLEKQILVILSAENMLVRIGLELQQLEKKKELLEKTKERLRIAVQENNSAMQQLTDLTKNENLEDLINLLKEKQIILQKFSQRQVLENNFRENNALLENIKLNLETLDRSKKEFESAIELKKDLSLELEEKKKYLLDSAEQEKVISIRVVQLQTNCESTKRHIQEIEKHLEAMLKNQEKITKLQELHHWLEDFFMPLSYTLEKQVMIAIHRHFDQLFQEWFSMLLAEENTYSRIDDSFAPIIIQNGYEISFSDLSGGEKTSAALAYRLALNKVINDVIHNIHTKDLLILDEPTDGFSAEQLDKVREVLDKLNLGQTIIVSHESKIEGFVQNIIRINKEGHVSNIISH
ncbi:MAG: SMC family ATPase [Nanoarchaeota archaeon]